MKQSLCTAANGERRHARDLYNPTKTLLAKIFQDRPVFPTDRFATPAWIEVRAQLDRLFLCWTYMTPMSWYTYIQRKILMVFVLALQVLSQMGLRSEVDHVTFLACARELESWGLSMDDMGERPASESIAVARELVQELKGNHMLHSSELFSALRDVAFVPAIKVRSCHMHTPRSAPLRGSHNQHAFEHAILGYILTLHDSLLILLQYGERNHSALLKN